MSSPLLDMIKSAKLIKQGAEAKVYKASLYPIPSIYYPDDQPLPSTSTLTPIPVLIKYRFPKTYRHTSLDVILTRQRLTAEARALVGCSKVGVKVPGLRLVDHREGILGIEWIEGWSVREVLGGGQDDDMPEDEIEDDQVDEAEEDMIGNDNEVRDYLRQLGVEDEPLLESIGGEIAKMHLADVIHGDLTTSNMMLRLKQDTSIKPVFDLVMIDFGLATISPLPEDRAVDLYVLERAFASTHPIPLLPSGEDGIPHFTTVLEGYRKVMETKGRRGEWTRVQRRLDAVRGRGRKRSMVG